MLIVCPGCKNRITLDDATLPSGIFKVRCTGCGKTISAQKNESLPQQAVSERASVTGSVADQTFAQSKDSVPSAVQEFIQTQIGAARKEILDAIQALFRGSSLELAGSSQGNMLAMANSALVCSGDQATVDAVLKLLNTRYQVTTCVTAAESLKAIDTSFGMIVIDPSFTDDLEGAKKIIGRINAKKAIDRRQMFVILISSTQKSLDGNAAFLNGVNLIVNKADLNNLESYIRQGKTYFEQFYSTIQSIVA